MAKKTSFKYIENIKLLIDNGLDFMFDNSTLVSATKSNKATTQQYVIEFQNDKMTSLLHYRVWRKILFSQNTFNVTMLDSMEYNWNSNWEWVCLVLVRISRQLVYACSVDSWSLWNNVLLQCNTYQVWIAYTISTIFIWLSTSSLQDFKNYHIIRTNALEEKCILLFPFELLEKC